MSSVIPVLKSQGILTPISIASPGVATPGSPINGDAFLPVSNEAYIVWFTASISLTASSSCTARFGVFKPGVPYFDQAMEHVFASAGSKTVKFWGSLPCWEPLDSIKYFFSTDGGNLTGANLFIERMALGFPLNSNPFAEL